MEYAKKKRPIRIILKCLSRKPGLLAALIVPSFNCCAQVEVEASAEESARTREDNGSDLGISIRLEQQLAQVREHGAGNSILMLRAIEGDAGDMSIRRVQQAAFRLWVFRLVHDFSPVG